MSHESILKNLREDLAPPSGCQRRIKQRLQTHLSVGSVLLSEAKEVLIPAPELKQSVWARITASLPSVSTIALLDRFRALLTPAAALRTQLQQRMLPHLTPVPTASFSQHPVKWVAAFVVVALVLKAGPQVFLAPQTVADSAVTLVPTRGEVSVLVADLWQPVHDEFVLEPGIMVRTESGEASILFHDDGVVRLDANTTLQVLDTSRRLDPATDLMPTFAIRRGRVWVQGLVPPHVRGLTIATSYGHVSVHEGSVAIAEEHTVNVSVWNRRAQVSHDDAEVFLVASERTEMWDGNVLTVKKIADTRYDDQWVQQNLQRDAVHRREIAQLQHERRIALAGILPTSRLYPVKRVAETVDVLLTFDEKERIEKRLQQADTRLNEAAALIAEGQSMDASITLKEYEKTLLDIATGSGNMTIAQFLIQRSLVETTADVAAALPGDDAYVIKKAVLVATAGLADSYVSTDDVQGVLFVDILAALMQAMEYGDSSVVHETWLDLQPYLAILEDEDADLDPELRKEATTLLSQVAVAIVGQKNAEEVYDEALLADVSSYLPVEPELAVLALSEEDVMAIVQAVRDRIFLYDMKQSRINQLFTELRALNGHPEQGRILRRLHLALPNGPEHFPDRVRREITRLRWERAIVL